MPPPQNIQPGFYEPQPSPAIIETVAPTPQISVEEPTQAHIESVPQPEEIKSETQRHTFVHEPSVSPAPPSPSPLSDATPIPQSTSSYSQMGSISTSELSDAMAASSSTPIVASSATSSDLPSSSSQQQFSAKWAIWSRRPQDPSHAPGIIISPRARPPPDVVQQALDMKTPPTSIPCSPVVAKTEIPDVKNESKASVPVSLKETETTMSPSLSLDTFNSSSVTETSVSTAGTPTVSGSPASSHTSLSGSVIASSQSQKEIIIQAPLEAEKRVDSKPLAIESATLGSAPEPTKAADEKVEIPIATTPTTTGTTKTEMLASPQPAVAATLSASGSSITLVPTPSSPAPSATSSATPSVPPADVAILTPAAPAPKKSWASLLRPTTSAASSGASPAIRNALPTSSVVGFSIPAASEAATPTVPVSTGKKNELLSLLTRGPTMASTPSYAAAGSSLSSTLLKIRPRGLINSGNMCFANSVLQILVYCPPFHHLFVELGKLLPGPVVNGAGASAVSGSSTPNGTGTGKVIKDSATPLVDATIDFLKEFVEDKKSKAMKERAKAKNVYIGIGANGAAVSGSGRGKGKEREVIAEDEEQDRDQDDWDGDSFLPTGVYDAMKVKKRFEGMGVSHIF